MSFCSHAVPIVISKVLAVCLGCSYLFHRSILILHGQPWLTHRSDVCKIRGIATRIRKFLAAQATVPPINIRTVFMPGHRAATLYDHDQ